MGNVNTKVNPFSFDENISYPMSEITEDKCVQQNKIYKTFNDIDFCEFLISLS